MWTLYFQELSKCDMTVIVVVMLMLTETLLKWFFKIFIVTPAGQDHVITS